MNDQTADNDLSIKQPPTQWQFGLRGVFGLFTVLAFGLSLIRALHQADNPLTLFFSLIGLGAFLPVALPRRAEIAEFTPSRGSEFLLSFFMIGLPVVTLASLLGMWLARFCAGQYAEHEFILAGGIGAGLGSLLLVWGLGIRYAKR